MNAFFVPFSWMTLPAFLAATHRWQVLLHRLRRAAHPSEVVPISGSQMFLNTFIVVDVDLLASFVFVVVSLCFA